METSTALTRFQSSPNESERNTRTGSSIVVQQQKIPSKIPPAKMLTDPIPPKSPSPSSPPSTALPSPFTNTDDQDSDRPLDAIPPQQQQPTSPTASASAPASKPPSVAHAKPKSARAHLSKSRSLPPPLLPPFTTVRLDISLGGPENYEVDISATAKVTGQRPPTPLPPKPRDTDDSEPDKEDRDKEQPKPKKKRVKHLSFVLQSAHPLPCAEKKLRF